MVKEPDKAQEDSLPALDLSPTLLELHAHIVTLRAVQRSFYTRLIVWGIAALKKQGYSSEWIRQILDRGMGAGKVWGVIRQHLSVEALEVLLQHLRREIERLDNLKK